MASIEGETGIYNGLAFSIDLESSAACRQLLMYAAACWSKGDKVHC